MHNENNLKSFNRVIFVLVADLMKTPPALSVIKALDDLGKEVIVCTVGNDKEKHMKHLGDVNNVQLEYAGCSYKDDVGKINKLKRLFFIRRNLWKIIGNYYNNNTVIWVMSDVSIKHLGKKITEKNYILHLLELIEDMYYISGNSILKMDRKTYTEYALAIVECEYNRAHITKAWWDLEKLPLVLPNKPYVTIDIPKNSKISTSSQLEGLIQKLRGKKIVLYQGNISKERPLDMYIKAINELGDDWAFVMMLNGGNPYPEIQTKNAYFVPFVEPPYHLEVTSHAYIGILSYVPIKNSHSILNTLYCAPNKIWEYAKYGVPMISNDLPALKYEFETKKIGLCTPSMSVEAVKNTLIRIDERYSEFTKASSDFFDNYDYKKSVEDIIEYSFGQKGE